MVTNDTLPDQWEEFYFCDLHYGPYDDPDGDGRTNIQEMEMGTDPNRMDTDGDGASDGEECVAGTDPQDHTSLLMAKMERIMDHILLTWQGQEGRTYDVLVRENMMLGNWQNLSGYTQINGTNGPIQQSIPLLEEEGQQYYIIRVWSE